MALPLARSSWRYVSCTLGSPCDLNPLWEEALMAAIANVKRKCVDSFEEVKKEKNPVKSYLSSAEN